MPPLPVHSPFHTIAAVAAWDAWFRWREGGVLRDMAIEDTWQRVAVALAAAETGPARWEERFFAALSGWRVLPDERLLAAAGTGTLRLARQEPLAAVVNAAAFVPAGRGGRADIDLPAVAEQAGIVVRMLDNARLLGGVATSRLRIGIVGLADALLLLGLRYDSTPARTLAGKLAEAIRTGALRASTELAAERGAEVRDAPAHTDAELHSAIARHGLRHAQLTAVLPRPRLALLADDVADALEPLAEDPRLHRIDAGGGGELVASAGHARSLLRARGRHPDPAGVETVANVSWQARLALRAAVQPWLDEAIDYPLQMPPPAPAEADAAREMASLHGLGNPAWFVAGSPAGERPRPRR